MSGVIIDKMDRALLDALQFDFPLTVTPFKTLAARLGCTERDILGRIESLKRSGVIRQISPIYDSFHIGYRSTLAAFKVPAHLVEKTAAVLSAHPGVSHNYLRNGEYNLWFTLTLLQEKNMERAIGALARKTRIAHWMYLPAIKTFKVNFRLDMGGTAGKKVSSPKILRRDPGVAKEKADPAFVRATQGDLLLVSRPWARAADALGVSEAAVVKTLRAYIKNAMIRRVAAVLRQNKAGFTHNIMVAWAPLPGQVESLGAIAAAQKLVSHCYQRPSKPDWPYSVYTMIHGTNKRDVQATIRTISHLSAKVPFCELETVKEFKKVRVTYF